MGNLKIISVNANGLMAGRKRRSVFDRVRREKPDICLIQESHSTELNKKIWRSEWGGPAYFRHGTSNSRGVMTLIGRDLEHSVGWVIDDKDG